jgi:hypothetical protein
LTAIDSSPSPPPLPSILKKPALGANSMVHVKEEEEEEPLIMTVS